MPEEWEERLERRPGVKCLPYNVSVTMPVECSGCKEAREFIKREMIDMFGGATVFEADGYWVDDEGHLVSESVEVIEASHGCMDDKDEQRFNKMVYRGGQMAKQQAVFIKQGKAFIVKTGR